MVHRAIHILFVSTLLLVNPMNVLGQSDKQDVKWYSFGSHPEQRLGVIQPADSLRATSRGAVVYFHGGGWYMGTAEWGLGVAQKYAEMGLVGITAGYRLSDQVAVTPIDAIDDARSAVRWVREHSGELKIDPDRIVVRGSSAGGHLASMIAELPEDSVGSETSCVPNALVLISPAVNLTRDGWFVKLLGPDNNASDYSPVDQVRSGMPPTLILQGKTDTVTPAAGAEKFCNEMHKAGNRCDLVLYDHVGHLFTPEGESDQDMPNPDPKVAADAWQKAEQFLKSLGYL